MNFMMSTSKGNNLAERSFQNTPDLLKSNKISQFPLRLKYARFSKKEHY